MTQEIERVVLPGVHYMPFTMQNVSEVVQYVLAEENAAEMQAMVRRAHTVLAEELGLEKGAERMRDDLVRLWAGTGATRADPASPDTLAQDLAPAAGLAEDLAPAREAVGAPARE